MADAHFSDQNPPCKEDFDIYTKQQNSELNKP